MGRLATMLHGALRRAQDRLHPLQTLILEDMQCPQTVSRKQLHLYHSWSN